MTKVSLSEAAEVIAVAHTEMRSLFEKSSDIHSQMLAAQKEYEAAMVSFSNQQIQINARLSDLEKLIQGVL